LDALFFQKKNTRESSHKFFSKSALSERFCICMPANRAAEVVDLTPEGFQRQGNGNQQRQRSSSQGHRQRLSGSSGFGSAGSGAQDPINLSLEELVELELPPDTDAVLERIFHNKEEEEEEGKEDKREDLAPEDNHEPADDSEPRQERASPRPEKKRKGPAAAEQNASGSLPADKEKGAAVPFDAEREDAEGPPSPKRARSGPPPISHDAMDVGICPVCGHSVQQQLLESHVNRCLDSDGQHGADVQRVAGEFETLLGEENGSGASDAIHGPSRGPDVYAENSNSPREGGEGGAVKNMKSTAGGKSPQTGNSPPPDSVQIEAMASPGGSLRLRCRVCAKVHPDYQAVHMLEKYIITAVCVCVFFLSFFLLTHTLSHSLSLKLKQKSL
jgi:hypothetical protein